MKKVSVVILNWNGEKLLAQFLPSVIKYTDIENVEIVVADNCSTDNSIRFISENFPAIRIITLPENYGYAKGYNEALKQVNAEYVILLNSDVEVTEGWLSQIIQYMDTNPDVVAVQPKILSYRYKEDFEYAGASGGFIDKYGYPFCRGRIFNVVEKDINQYTNVIDVFWASGACLAIRLKDFFDAGGFDEFFFAHMEEIDLCWRLNARGKRLVCLPHSVVYHVGAATLSVESPHKTFLNFRNNLLMLYKNLPEKDLKKTLRIRHYLDILAIVQFYISGKKENAKAVRKAYKEFSEAKKDYISVRKENLDRSTKTDIETIYPKSILWTFYKQGKKKFSQLIF